MVQDFFSYSCNFRKKKIDNQAESIKLIGVFSVPQGGRQAPGFLGIGCKPSTFVSSWCLCLTKSCMVGECVATAAVFFFDVWVLLTG